MFGHPSLIFGSSLLASDSLLRVIMWRRSSETGCVQSPRKGSGIFLKILTIRVLLRSQIQMCNQLIINQNTSIIITVTWSLSPQVNCAVTFLIETFYGFLWTCFSHKELLKIDQWRWKDSLKYFSNAKYLRKSMDVKCQFTCK